METTDLQATLGGIATSISRTVNLLEQITQKLTSERPVYISYQEFADNDERALALFKALGWEK